MKKRETAAEFLAALESDPDFVAKRRQQEAAFSARSEALQLDEAPLVADLRAAGFDVTSVWDLVNSALDYPRAVPILLAHLDRPYSSPIREGVARALGTPSAIREWPALVERYKAEKDHRVKDGLAAAISAIANDSVIDSVIDLVRDSTNGPSRLLLLRALAKSREPNAREMLMTLRDDPEFEKEARFLARTSKQAKK